ncbi:helix-turn-helix domain-containing protein [Escherichia coli]|uniref:helix-turn-helix domain-containing protein n=1 Tax=Escherichia coli TaxID=562 RepID=UPI003B56B21E
MLSTGPQSYVGDYDRQRTLPTWHHSASICRALLQRDAADILELSVRQVQRLVRLYRTDGATAFASSRRGRPANQSQWAGKSTCRHDPVRTGSPGTGYRTDLRQ